MYLLYLPGNGNGLHAKNAYQISFLKKIFHDMPSSDCLHFYGFLWNVL